MLPMFAVERRLKQDIHSMFVWNHFVIRQEISQRVTLITVVASMVITVVTSMVQDSLDI